MIIPQLERAVNFDGELTRAKIDRIDARLDMNDGLTRIKAEVVPNPQSLVWHDGIEQRSECRVWSLDNGLGDADESLPMIEESSHPSA